MPIYSDGSALGAADTIAPSPLASGMPADTKEQLHKILLPSGGNTTPVIELIESLETIGITDVIAISGLDRLQRYARSAVDVAQTTGKPVVYIFNDAPMLVMPDRPLHSVILECELKVNPNRRDLASLAVEQGLNKDKLNYEFTPEQRLAQAKYNAWNALADNFGEKAKSAWENESAGLDITTREKLAWKIFIAAMIVDNVECHNSGICDSEGIKGEFDLIEKNLDDIAVLTRDLSTVAASKLVELLKDNQDELENIKVLAMRIGLGKN